YSELLEEQERMAREKAAKEKERRKYSDVEESDESGDDRRRHKKRRHSEVERERGAWVREDEEESEVPTTSRKHRDSERGKNMEDSDSETEEAMDYKNVLGEEKDVSKGVGAMLKLAAEKGYLEKNKKKDAGGTLKHLESKRFSKVEQGRYDIEDKYVKKLERMGTTGTGPVRPFPEKADYVPKVDITYTDQKGRDLEPKEAFRVLSWKFHGKGPGKKQIEKRQAKQEKKEKLKKMNSMDTPLGTLAKQLKKQEQLQTPYLVLSGSRSDSGAPLTKE
uniref:Uncharacterized protein n=1 Tax=Acrobeloides nanus TaxID=290746 RepID=A0A914D9Q7_9BILA